VEQIAKSATGKTWVICFSLVGILFKSIRGGEVAGSCGAEGHVKRQGHFYLSFVNKGKMVVSEFFNDVLLN
jgi:hypothetical protein